MKFVKRITIELCFALCCLLPFNDVLAQQMLHTSRSDESVLHTKEQVMDLLASMQQPVHDIRLPWIIEGICGYQVHDWQGEERVVFEAAATRVIETTVKFPVEAKRVNEVGLSIEKRLREALSALNVTAEIPTTKNGSKRSAGYPDLWVKTSEGVAFYIEVKTYSAKNVDTTQRSFYLSPSANFKVTGDAYHLLLAFEMEKLTDDALDQYIARSFKLVDLYELECDLKYEFNASNRDLYGESSTLLE